MEKPYEGSEIIDLAKYKSYYIQKTSDCSEVFKYLY